MQLSWLIVKLNKNKNERTNKMNLFRSKKDRAESRWDSVENLENIIKQSCKTQLKMTKAADKIIKLEKKRSSLLLKGWSNWRIKKIRNRWQPKLPRP